VFAEFYKRRDGIDVRGEHYVGVAASGVNIWTAAADVLSLHLESCSPEIFDEVMRDRLFVAADRRNRDQVAREFQDIHLFYWANTLAQAACLSSSKGERHYPQASCLRHKSSSFECCQVVEALDLLLALLPLLRSAGPVQLIALAAAGLVRNVAHLD